MTGQTEGRDPQGRLTRASGAPRPAQPWPEPGDVPTSLPAWLLKELRRAGVSDETILGLDEETARDLVAEIRSDALE